MERQFEISGEALNRLHRADEEIAGQSPEYQRIIAFRNILIHGYAVIQSHTVWGVVEGDLPALAEGENAASSATAADIIGPKLLRVLRQQPPFIPQNRPIALKTLESRPKMD